MTAFEKIVAKKTTKPPLRISSSKSQSALVFYELSDPGGTYFVRESGSKLIKIGKATIFHERFASAETFQATRLEILALYPELWFEALCHERFAHLREHGEWFRPEQDLLDFIYKIDNLTWFNCEGCGVLICEEIDTWSETAFWHSIDFEEPPVLFCKPCHERYLGGIKRAWKLATDGFTKAVAMTRLAHTAVAWDAHATSTPSHSAVESVRVRADVPNNQVSTGGTDTSEVGGN